MQVQPRRELDLGVEVPGSELEPVASKELWAEIYDRLAELIRRASIRRSSSSTRAGTSERVSHHLAERLGDDAVAAHHGSLSRKIRLDAEHRLEDRTSAGARRDGLTRARHRCRDRRSCVPDRLSAIDCRRGAANRPRRPLARRVPKGRLFATTRDDLIECAALVLAIRRGELDRLVVPQAPLDICPADCRGIVRRDEWDEDELLALVRRAYPYRDLSALSTRTFSRCWRRHRGQSRRYGAYLFQDRVNRRLKARRGARLAAITGGGAIPETALYAVVAEPEGTTVGTVDEDFAVESLSGDIMLLGNTSWRIRRVSQGRVQVEDAHGAAPTIPFWNGEAPARTFELSQYVAEVRDTIDRMSRHASAGRTPGAEPAEAADAAVQWLEAECGLDHAGAEQAIDYIVTGRAVLGAVPTLQTIVAERFFDEGGGMQLVIHAPFGGRITKAWGLALRKRFCRSFNFELQAAATDDGLNISLAEQHSFPLADVFHYLHTASVQHVLEQAVLPAPVFGSRWRWDASRSLALQRFRGGKRVPLHIQRMQSDDLLASVFPDAAACPENLSGDIELPDHPLVREVMKDVLTEAMDIDGLKDVLKRIEEGAITCVAVDTPVPSVFSHEILNANPYAYLDDAPLEERRARAVEMRRMLPESVLSEVGRLDPAAIAEVTRDAWPDVRDADDLHDALQTLVVLPPQLGSSWRKQFDDLLDRRRAVTLGAAGRQYWVASERARAASTLFADGTFTPEPPLVEMPELNRDQAIQAAVQGWMAHVGPTTADELSSTLGLREMRSTRRSSD